MSQRVWLQRTYPSHVSCPEHRIEHPIAAPQAVLVHAPVPEQVMSHIFAPHRAPSPAQEPTPEHSIVQASPVHRMPFLQLPSPVQRIVQSGEPQMIWSGQLWGSSHRTSQGASVGHAGQELVEHVITQVPPSHVPGHAPQVSATSGGASLLASIASVPASSCRVTPW
jgi:hypothetical protein